MPSDLCLLCPLNQLTSLFLSRCVHGRNASFARSHDQILEKSTFSTNSRAYEKVDWRLWYLNFVCSGPKDIYRSMRSLTLNEFVSLSHHVCFFFGHVFSAVIGINFEWFSFFFIMMASSSKALFVVFSVNSPIASGKKGHPCFIRDCIFFEVKWNTRGKKKPQRSDANLFWWMKYWFTHFMRSCFSFFSPFLPLFLLLFTLPLNAF